MKKQIKLNRLFISMLMLGCSLGFVACSDDDETTPTPPVEVTTDHMFGNYTGKMLYLTESSTTEDGTDGGEDTPEGTDVAVKVDNDTVYFDSFPIKDIVLDIVGDEETANKIVEAVGDVSYKIGYEPELNTEKDSILFVLDPKPLELNVSIPTETEGGEAQNLHIEVKVSPVDGANYEVETTNLKFKIYVPEVSLGEGDNEPVALPGFVPATFDFELKKN